MSLRVFHLVFIALSVILAAFFAAWAVTQYRVEREGLYAVSGIMALGVAAALAAYGAAFQRKTKNL
jgi:hypothetical protein